VLILTGLQDDVPRGTGFMALTDHMREAVRAQPFRPFDLVLVDGRRYTIEHPDWLAIPPVARPHEIEVFEVAKDRDDYRSHWINVNLIQEVVKDRSPATIDGGQA
jgi:hypothetical protein